MIFMNLLQSKILWIVVIFVAAASFRLTNLELVEFKLDEARDVLEMERFFNEPYFIQRGTIQSTGVYNPPIWYYVLNIISLPSRDAQYLSFMIALLNCGAVAGFYFVVRKYYGQTVGIFSGLLLAFSPWAILMSRKIWAPDLIMVFLVPWLYFVHIILRNSPRRSPSATVRGVPWEWFWVVLLLSLMAQLHASGMFLAVAAFVGLLVLRVKMNWKFALLGLMVSLITYLPYVAYQIQNSCPDCQTFVSYQSEEVGVDGNVFLRPFQLLGGSSFEIVLGSDFQLFADSYPLIRIINMFFLVVILGMFAGIGYLIKGYKRKEYLFLLIVSGVVTLLYFITKTPAHMHYFLIVLPIMILIFSVGLSRLGGKRFWIPACAGMTVVIVNIFFMMTFYEFLSLKKDINGDYGTIYSLSKEQAQERNMKIEEYVIYLYNNP